MSVPSIKSMRFTSRWHNIGKHNKIVNILIFVKDLKNEISQFCHQNLIELLNNNKFNQNYKKFKNNYLPSHTVQTLFSDIAQLYLNKIKSLSFKYKIKTKYSHIKNHTLLNLVSYIIKTNFPNTFNTIEEIEQHLKNINTMASLIYLDVLKNIKHKDKLLKIINQRTKNILRNIKPIEFITGTFRLTTGNGYAFEIHKDYENTQFKFFLELKFNKHNKIRLPIQINEQYHCLDAKFKKQILIIDRTHTRTKKLHFSIAYNYDYKYLIDDERKEDIPIGIDLNLTRNRFLVTSDGYVLDYDEEFLEPRLKLLKIYFDKGINNLTSRQKQKFKEIFKSVEWYIEYKIAIFINQLREEGYTTIVLEDLKPFQKSNIKINLFGYTFKANTFLRFLRVSGLKQTIRRIAANRGIKVHFVNPAYTSQQCSNCGYIDKDNRITQDKFHCKKCNYETNADMNAARNILMRYLNKDYFVKLCIINKKEWKGHNLFDSKDIKFHILKQILESKFKPMRDVLAELPSGLNCAVSQKELK